MNRLHKKWSSYLLAEQLSAPKGLLSMDVIQLMLDADRCGYKEAVTADKQDPEECERCHDEPRFQGGGHWGEGDRGIWLLQVPYLHMQFLRCD